MAAAQPAPQPRALAAEEKLQVRRSGARRWRRRRTYLTSRRAAVAGLTSSDRYLALSVLDTYWLGPSLPSECLAGLEVL